MVRCHSASIGVALHIICCSSLVCLNHLKRTCRTATCSCVCWNRVIVSVYFSLLIFICCVPCPRRTKSERRTLALVGRRSQTFLLGSSLPAGEHWVICVCVCVCVRRSHTLLRYFLWSMAVVGLLHTFLFLIFLFSFSRPLWMHTDRRRKHLIAFYHENKQKHVLVCRTVGH